MDKERQDVLCDDVLLINGVDGFVQNFVRNFENDYSQFIVLVRASYVALTSSDINTMKCLSFSAYQYYCTVLLWRRILYVTSNRSHVSNKFLQLDAALHFDLPVPKEISLYLRSVGDVNHASLGNFHLKLQAVLSNQRFNGAQGGYGRIDSSNHVIYETVPSLMVALLKVRADIMVTDKEKGFQVDWDLPKDIRPIDSAALLPNNNLLCWAQAEELTPSQRMALKEAGITKTDFNVENVACLPVNVSLVEYVAVTLENSKAEVAVVDNESGVGSVAQIPYTIRWPDDTKVEAYRAASAKVGETCSCAQMSAHAASAAATFRFRLQRRTDKECDMLCYRFAENPPQNWMANANEVFEFGAGKALWNTAQFKLPEQDGESLVNHLATSKIY